METTIFETEKYTFLLEVKKDETGRESSTRILRREKNSGEDLVLMSYTWPKPLLPQVSLKAPGSMENGELSVTLSLTVHHISGMVQGEFTEEEDYTVLDPDGSEKEIVCSVTDIRRKTRFAIGERHLEHVPHRTYPPVDGKQGPYGHPSVQQTPPVPVKKRES